MEFNNVYNLDCLVGVSSLPDNSVDLIVTDPPYGTMAGGGKTKKAMYKNMDWDIPFDLETYLTAVARVLRPSGKLVMFAMEPLASRLIATKYPLLEFNYKCYWLKNTPGMILGAKKNPLSYVEEILVFSKARNLPAFDADKLHPLREYFIAERDRSGLTPADFRELLGNGMASHYFTLGEQFILPTEKNYIKLQSTGYFNRPYSDLKEVDDEFKKAQAEKRAQVLQEYSDRYPSVFNLPSGASSKRNVFEYPKEGTSLHPTQKPVALIEDLIQTYSEPGDVVLDTFMGSGTTAVACIRTGRDFIGFELNEGYHAIAQQRIWDAVDALLWEGSQ